MANMVTITEARFIELLRAQERYDELTKCQQASYDAMKKERDEWKEQAERERDWRLGMLKEIETTGRGIAIDLDDSERCIDKIQKIEFDDKPTGLLMREVDEIINDYRKAQEAK